jgi:hypothetical protein
LKDETFGLENEIYTYKIYIKNYILPLSPFSFETFTVQTSSKQSMVTQIPKCAVSVTFPTVVSTFHHLGK